MRGHLHKKSTKLHGFIIDACRRDGYDKEGSKIGRLQKGKQCSKKSF